MTASSDGRPGTTRTFDEFASVVEADLLRAAWLITTDRHRATEVTEIALARTSRHWTRGGEEQPVQHVFHELVRAIKESDTAAESKPATQAADEPGMDRIQLRRREAEVAFESVPMKDRIRLVLHRYANLSTWQVAGIVGGTPDSAEQHSDRGLTALRSRTTDLAGLPFDDVPCPAQAADHERIAGLANRETRTSRRRVLSSLLGASAAVAVGVGAWWMGRPYEGLARLDESALPFKPRSSGLLFVWLRTMKHPPDGVAPLIASGWMQGTKDIELRLAMSDGRPVAQLDGRRAPFVRTPWGCYASALPPYRYGDDGPTQPQSLVFGKVPADTDLAWVVASGSVSGESEMIGLELRDHATFAAGRHLGPLEGVQGLMWRTASQQITLSDGENASFVVTQQNQTVYVFTRAGMWGFLDEDHTMSMSIVGGDQPETMDVQFGQRGWGFIAMLPRGAHTVKATATHRFRDAVIEINVLQESGYTVLTADSAVDPPDYSKDGAVISVIERIDWIGSDGRSRRWTVPTHPPLPSVPALAPLPRNRRRAGGPT